jgi:hypothetical protein
MVTVCYCSLSSLTLAVNLRKNMIQQMISASIANSHAEIMCYCEPVNSNYSFAMQK